MSRPQKAGVSEPLTASRSWWTVLGWVAFAEALSIECVALFRSVALSGVVGWITLALYVAWIVFLALGERTRRLRRGATAAERWASPRVQWIVTPLSVLASLVVLTNIDALRADHGVPLGAILLAFTFLGWLAGPGVQSLFGKRPRPASPGSDADASEARKHDATGAPRRGRRGTLVVAGVALFALYQCFLKPAPPPLAPEEVEAALAELEEVHDESWGLLTRLQIRLIRLRESGDADPGVVEALDQRKELAAGGVAEATLWKIELEKGRVRAAQRDELRRAIEGIRADLERARNGMPSDAP